MGQAGCAGDFPRDEQGQVPDSTGPARGWRGSGVARVIPAQTVHDAGGRCKRGRDAVGMHRLGAGCPGAQSSQLTLGKVLRNFSGISTTFDWR
ncbi:hypothetical protein TUM18999_19880 [Pseudomonas tohonis]|uniref:Uncharacterized protein n=1 Tax=Pseudomonas tohonis TaxID=2725477 RepID=A0A6J4E207_9PSED|nr:hypothetical protein TUM18999_19880 [Pseudomonas tohonis]GJN51841.1 hypothetical protein TUM20286_15930 [Pseudomonas tohonis]